MNNSLNLNKKQTTKKVQQNPIKILQVSPTRTPSHSQFHHFSSAN